MPSRGLDDLVAAVADGDQIDWQSARDTLSEGDTNGILRALEHISSGLHPRAAAVSSKRRLPKALELVRWLVVARCSAAIAGVALLLVTSRMPPVFAVIFTTFFASALYLELAGTNRRTRALALCFWITASSFGFRGINELVRRWPDSEGLALFGLLYPEAFFAAGFWQLAKDFPAFTHFGAPERVAAIGYRITVAIGTLLLASNVLPAVTTNETALTIAKVLSRTAGDGPVFWLLVFGFAIPALCVVAWRGWGAQGAESARVRIFLIGVASAFVPATVQSVIEIAAPPYARLMRTPVGNVLSSLVVYAPLFLFPVATANAVAAVNVLGLRATVQRGLRYLLAKWLLVAAAVAPLVGVAIQLYRRADLSLATALVAAPVPRLLWLAAGGGVALVFRPRLLNLLDRWMLPGSEASSMALARLTGVLKHARTPLEIARTLAEATSRTLHADVEPYLMVAGRLEAIRGSEPLSSGSLIGALMQGAREPVVVGARYKRSFYPLLASEDREWIDRSRIELLVPVAPGRSGADLLGFVALKGRQNALNYSQDDIRFLQAAAAAVSLACDAVLSEGRGTESTLGVVEEVARECASCGQVFEWASDERCSCATNTPRPAVLPKRLFGRYEIGRRLGAGGMGVVYLAKDLSLGRDVALKTLPRLTDDGTQILMTEARTMASLSYEDIAVLYGVEQWRGTPILSMEYLERGTLALRLVNGPIEPAIVEVLSQRLALHLDAAARSGLVPRRHQADQYWLRRGWVCQASRLRSGANGRHDEPRRPSVGGNVALSASRGLEWAPPWAGHGPVGSWRGPL